ncbi:FliO/MopB family protein [Sphingomonas sp. 37zxx]|uniref:FliO/MopB family protein n=1 Tax=Sphingomonas sp. 37zxx TaxID=1550073 RepID=UPI000ADB4CDD|nr:flagellar biosynthetic protein FliO [Sphingomonas sp. 37zxx]
MDPSSLLRMLGGLAVVLAILSGALWMVRRFDLRLPGRAISSIDRRLELIETLPIDGRRMIALVRRDGHEHLMLIAPEGHLIIENAITKDATDIAAEEERALARAEAAVRREEQREARAAAAAEAVESFSILVDRARQRTAPAAAAFTSALEHAARSIASARSGTAPVAATAADATVDPTGASPAPRTEPAAAAPSTDAMQPPVPLPGGTRTRRATAVETPQETDVA